MSGQTIEDGWHGLLSSNGIPEDATEDQITLLKVVFYTGAAVMHEIFRTVGDATSDELAEFIEVIEAEDHSNAH